MIHANSQTYGRTYYLSEKAGLILYSNLLNQMNQNFLFILYIVVYRNILALFTNINSTCSVGVPQSSTLYIYYIYIELASTQSPFFQNLPSECTASVRNQNKDIEFWLSAHIVRAYPYMDQSMQSMQIASIQLYKILKVTKRCMQRLAICSSLVFVSSI